jgi:fatty-acyl-CoA synthase
MSRPETVAALVLARAGDDSVGVVLDDRAWTWREVVEESARYASALVGRTREGAGSGPFHVGVLLENRPEFLFTLFGAALAGATTVAINSTRRGAELARDVRHTDCSFVVSDAAQAPLLHGLDLGGIAVVDVDTPEWADRLARAGLPPPSPPVAPDDLFELLFTSGSTGAPKAVRMTHGRAARSAAGARWFTSDDVLYCPMPLFHGNSLHAIVLPALATGATIALRPRFSASQFLPDLRRYRATFFSTVGRALAYVLATLPRADDRDHDVKYGLAPESSPADMRAFTERFGIPLVSGYGSSENAIVLVPRAAQPRDALGVPQGGTDVAVVDPETGVERAVARLDEQGRLLNPGEAVGEIVGRNVVDRFEGYYENPEADAERTRNGWYWSGDLGYRDESGLFYFAGRRGEWLRVDGENFAAGPVERILSRFPGTSAVAVYAVPDERTADDQVMAAIEPVAGAAFDPDAFARFLHDQPDLGTKWAPRYVRLGLLPVGGTNKVDKQRLRRDRWECSEPVYWRPARAEQYRLMTDADRVALAARFHEFGRAGALRRP